MREETASPSSSSGNRRMVMNHTVDLKDKKLFILDMDGTIYLGNRLFDGTLQFLETARKNGARCVFLTNNSSKSTKEYIEKLRKMGIECGMDDVFTSVQASAIYLKANHMNGKVYAAGTKAMLNELLEMGIDATGRPDGNEGVVLQGFDTELEYWKVEAACRLIDNGAVFLACNIDKVCPVEDGYIPDCGSICKMIESATGKAPHFIGKPEASMIEGLLMKEGIEAKYAVMVGDRLYTDIACGVNANVDTVLLLSGETSLQDLEGSSVAPTYIMKDIAQLGYEIRRI